MAITLKKACPVVCTAEDINADAILSTDSLNSASQDAPVLLDADHSLEETTGKK